MNEVKQEYTGIDPAPEPVSVPVAKVEKSKKSSSFQPEPRWVIAIGFGIFTAFLVSDLPMVKMAQMMAISKLLVLSPPVAMLLVVIGTFAVPTLGIYIALTTFPKLLDAAQCVLGGLYHSACYALMGVGAVFKNIGPIAKTCIQIPAGFACPAYATHLSSKKWEVSFEASAQWDTPEPHLAAVSYVCNAVCLLGVGLGTFLAYISDKTWRVSYATYALAYLCYLILNVLYIVGRCARERKEKANGTTV